MKTEHRFTPTHYYTSLGPHEPVLHVGDGDTIITTTVDARGFDHRREQVTPRGNPQTGPFYVDGAEPGDTLVLPLVWRLTTYSFHESTFNAPYHKRAQTHWCLARYWEKDRRAAF